MISAMELEYACRHNDFSLLQDPDFGKYFECRLSTLPSFYAAIMGGKPKPKPKPNKRLCLKRFAQNAIIEFCNIHKEWQGFHGLVVLHEIVRIRVITKEKIDLWKGMKE